MSTYYASKHGAGRANTIAAMQDRRPFKSGGALSGVKEPYNSGRLTGNDYDKFHAEVPSYAVYSYSTPIAWWSPTFGWTLAESKFSATTSSHQSLVRAALQ